MTQLIRISFFLVLLAASSLAATIGTLNNTGVSAPGNATADPNWTVGLGAVPTGNAFRTNSAAFPLLIQWLPNNATSLWISPQASYGAGQTDSPGQWVYQTTFDLTGYVAATATIDFRLAVDDTFLGYRLNGSGLLGTGSSGFGAFSAFQSVNTATLVGGVNTLTFFVQNATGDSGNPTGLRVEFDANADLAPPPPVPEPAAFALMGAGLVGAALLRCKK